VNWISVANVAAVSDHRMDLNEHPYLDVFALSRWDNVGGTLEFTTGSTIIPLSTNSSIPPTTPVWTSAVPGFVSLSWVLAGGAQPEDSEVALYNPGTVGGLTRPRNWGSSLSAGLWTSPSPPDFGISCYMADAAGQWHRQTLGQFIGIESHLWQLTENFTDTTHTADTAALWGLGLAAILSDYHGREVYFEWSNFGEFEPLELPAVLRPENGTWMSSPTLLTGTDGRMHIIYHDLGSDEIRCLSTL
jgi:hypothetical protein